MKSLVAYSRPGLTKSTVERRRRETINEGINELAKIVPGCEKNKGSILQRGVEYITQLKNNETHNIEKWTLEKLLTDQAIGELSSSVDRLKDELQRTHREVARWKTACQSAGLEPKEVRHSFEAETQDTLWEQKCPLTPQNCLVIQFFDLRKQC